MELRLRVPRPEHKEADIEEQEVWKKKLAVSVVELVQQTYPDALRKIWAEDEHRVGLQPMTRRVWVEALEVPKARVNWRREWLWLYATSATPDGRD